MSLANFTNPSLEKLKVLLGSFSDDEVGRLEKQSIPYVESQWFKVTDEVDGVEEGSKEYKAVQVRADGSLVESGIEFDSDATYTGDIDEPVYFDNLQLNSTLFSGSVEVGKAYKVEAVEQESASEDNIYYIIPEGGGGGGDVFYCIFKNNEGNNLYTCDVYPNALFSEETEIALDATVRVFNVDYGEVLNDTKLTCWAAPSSDVDADYYAEAPTWQQEVT